MIKVGTPVFPDKPKSRKYSYPDVKYDSDGWADASFYLPADYDLVRIIYKDLSKQTGWHSGNIWDGLNINPSSTENEVVAWKKLTDEKQME